MGGMPTPPQVEDRLGFYARMTELLGTDGGDNQTWYMTMAGELRSKRDPSKCLETWANNVRMNACNGQSWQVWRLDADGELRNEWAMDRCLDVAGAPTYADAEAVVLWTSGVTMDVRVDTGGLKSMLRGGTGELIQMAFGGQGYVMIQPSESVVQGGAQQAQQQQSGAGGMLGGLLGG